MIVATRRNPSTSRERGFTLLELIVAAGILALIAVFSWRGLDALIREREAIAASQAVIDTLQRSFARIERDALLAGDVQLDGDGALRLVAGTASVDGVPAATVDYRLVDGTLMRHVEGVDHAPLPMIAGVRAVGLEAWAPGPRGGAWVRSRRAVATTYPTAAGPASANVAGGAANGVAALAVSPAVAALAASQQIPGLQPTPGAPGASAPAPPAVANATGIRLTLALSDGSTIVRDFVVGGG